MRSADYYYNGLNCDRWRPESQAGAALAVQVSGTVLQTAKRIGAAVARVAGRDSIQHNSLEGYMPIAETFGEFWITDSPGEIYPHEPVYTITSTLASETPSPLLRENVLLVPPVDHQSEEINTHWGVSLSLYSEFMYQVTGSTLGQKDESVWLGTQIDAEQFKLEDNIARKGPKVDEEILAAFFVKDGDEVLRLHPQLEKLFQNLYDKKWDRTDPKANMYETDPQAREYVDRLLGIMYDDIGIRDGWYVNLENMLRRGDAAQLPDTFHMGAFERSLVNSAHAGRPTLKSSQAMIVEVDPAPESRFTYFR